MNEEEIKLVFLDNIEDNYTINLAIALAEEWEEYKNKISKAIKYIEEHTENIDRGKYYEDYVETYDLLKILKGD